MASAITSFGADTFLNMLFGARTAVPADFYLALLTQAPGEHTTGELLSEPPAGVGYGRVQVPNSPAYFGAGAGGFVATVAEIDFPTATADWPDVITHYALCDGTYTGGVYLYGSFVSARRVKRGDRVSVPSGLLSLSIASLSTAVAGAF